VTGLTGQMTKEGTDKMSINEIVLVEVHNSGLVECRIDDAVKGEPIIDNVTVHSAGPEIKLLRRMIEPYNHCVDIGFFNDGLDDYFVNGEDV